MVIDFAVRVCHSAEPKNLGDIALKIREERIASMGENIVFVGNYRVFLESDGIIGA